MAADLTGLSGHTDLLERIERRGAWIETEKAAPPERWLYTLSAAEFAELERAADFPLAGLVVHPQRQVGR
ncbi:MAG: hypothetical protein COW55_06065 [Rhodobacteraceae bacterium CG17_big_fil_post_rev_8_21_14_2_50_65_11]|nr:MAG: hypothetical protein COW55_06065 [Rhodobacteraceae bacterium CG17_big_fil_post_rev_8_21_14_2_50_65_11]